MRFRIDFWLALGALLTAFLVAGMTVVFAPIEVQQGEVYKIIFLHVPIAANALGLCSFALAVCGIVLLLRPRENLEKLSLAIAEMGLMTTFLTLFTGSIWGKPTWNTYWTWDARITTTFILFILYFAYLALAHSMVPGSFRRKSLAFLSILIAIDVPIVYQSVNWWRNLHQPATIIQSRGQSMSPEILQYLLLNLATITILVLSLIYFRYRVLLQIQTRMASEHLAYSHKLSESR